MIEEKFFESVKLVFSLARLQMVNAKPEERDALSTMLNFETSLNEKLKEYNELKKESLINQSYKKQSKELKTA